MTQLSVIYVYYNTPDYLIKSIRSLQNNKGHQVEIIIVDNNSPQELPEEIVANKKLKIIKNKVNKGFGSALNQGARIAKGKYLIFLNPDTLVPSNFVRSALSKMNEDKRIGLLGVRYKNGDGRAIKSVGGHPTPVNILLSFSLLRKVLPNNKMAEAYWLSKFNYKKEQVVPVVAGACMVVRKSIFNKVHGFDEQFFMYFEEADLSERIRSSGYKVVYTPEITITHFVGKSSSDKEVIKRRFEASRYKFLKKHYGGLMAVLVEACIRIPTMTNIIVLFIFLLSLFLNLYRISDLMMFYGDFGRDYLAAREMIQTGEVPLRGIPSSVVWLHQGPLSIYFIALALLLGGMHPVAPAILYGSIASIATVLCYIVGRQYFNRYVGLLASAFFATSPLIVLNARMPYHTTAIPFFSLILFYCLGKVLVGRRKYLPVIFFFLGILFLLELSNAVLAGVVVLALFIAKIKPSRKESLYSLGSLALGITPFLVFDLKNHFIQTGGYVLWVLNRIRLFVGIGVEQRTSSNLGEAFITIINELQRIIFPLLPEVALLLFIGSIIAVVISIFSGSERKKSITILMWLGIPLTSFLVHAKPGVAYTPVLFPAISLCVGYLAYRAIRYNRAFIIPFLTLIIINASFLLTSNYFLTSVNTTMRPELVNYNYGLDLRLREDAARAIVKDAKGEKFSVIGGGYLKKIVTGVDNYKYLLLYYGGSVGEKEINIYRIYENKSEVKNKNAVIYESKYIAVTKNE